MGVFYRVIINLYFIINRMMVYPLFLLRKHGWFLLAAAVAVVVFSYFSKEDEPVQISHDNVPAAQAITSREDGNSAFSSDLLNMMSEPELNYYSQVFYWVMDNQPAGKAFDWSHHNTHGSLTPSEPFRNNLGGVCRRFTETLKAGSVEQQLEGIACRKNEGGWCKLRKSATPACNIGSKGNGFMDSLTNGVKGLF
jgi:hypothetical protein